MAALFNTQILLDALSPTSVFVKHACTQVCCADESLATKNSFLILDIDSRQPIANCPCLLYCYNPTMEFLETATTDSNGQVSFNVSEHIGEELYIKPNSTFYVVPKGTQNSFIANEGLSSRKLYFKDNWAFEVCRKGKKAGYYDVLEPISKASLDKLGFYIKFYYVAYENLRPYEMTDKYTYSMISGKKFAAKTNAIYPEEGLNGRAIIRVPHNFYTEDDNKTIYIDNLLWRIEYQFITGYACAFFGHNIQSLIFAHGHGNREVFNFLTYPEQNMPILFQKALATHDGKTILTTNNNEILQTMSYEAEYIEGYDRHDAEGETTGIEEQAELL